MQLIASGCTASPVAVCMVCVGQTNCHQWLPGIDSLTEFRPNVDKRITMAWLRARRVYDMVSGQEAWLQKMTEYFPQERQVCVGMPRNHFVLQTARLQHGPCCRASLVRLSI
jgi:hypothetical protein